MSLVNDLVIEVDRRSAERRSGGQRPCAGLSAASRPRRQRLRARPCALFASLAFLVALAAGWAIEADRELDPIATDRRLPAVSATRPRAASVADPADASRAGAAPAEPTPEEDPGHAGVDTTETGSRTRWERPTMIRQVALERRGRRATLRIETDGAVDYELLPRDDGRRVEIRVDSTLARDAGTAIDLAGTPIRSIETFGRAGRTQYKLELDAAILVASRTSEREEGTDILIDFESTPPGPSNDDGPPMDGLLAAPRPAAAPIERSPGAFAATAIPPSLALSTASDFRIARSEDDRRRVDRAEAKRLAELALREARFARGEQDHALALDRYRASLAILPGHRPTVAELADLLVELDRADEAIALVRELRRSSNRDSGLAMLHAKLLARTGDLPGAIELLDRSGHNPTEAPDLHALAAAYLQRAGEHELAIERYETLLRRYPGRPRWWMGLGISLEATDRSREALDVYRIAMQLGELPPKTRRWISARLEALDTEG